VLWTLAKRPPAPSTIQNWICRRADETKNLIGEKGNIGPQLEGPTPKNKFGYKYSQIQTDDLMCDAQHLVLMSLEIHGIFFKSVLSLLNFF
jgi:DNA polymerase zeta